MKHSLTRRGERVLLRQPCTADLEALRLWRNDPANSRYIRSVGEITPTMQQAWFAGYLADENHMMFAVEADGVLIGSVSLYDFEKDSAEFGKIMIGNPEARGKGFAAEVTETCLKIGFEDLALTEIHATVHTENIAALRTYVRVGFLIAGEQPFSGGKAGREYLLTVTPARFYALHPRG